MKDAYKRLARALDRLPSGFPETESGVELRLLARLFTSEEADIFCALSPAPRRAAEMAPELGLSPRALEHKLTTMADRGLVLLSGTPEGPVFSALPWITGIYEFQVASMDAGTAALWEEYRPAFGAHFLETGPAFMQVLPVERALDWEQEALPYDRVRELLTKAGRISVRECVCRKQKGLLGRACRKPRETCLAIDPPQELLERPYGGREISQAEALSILDRAEEAGLVHLTANVKQGRAYLCNCCGCCCDVLGHVRETGSLRALNSRYRAGIDPELCTGCGLCAIERCQVAAIERQGEVFAVVEERCIGCGLCATACPAAAIRLRERPPQEREESPADDGDWGRQRLRERGYLG